MLGLTSDIGLAVKFDKREEGDVEKRVQCTLCKQDNDLNIENCQFHESTYHEPERIHEVCVKSDNESIYYLCDYHVTAKQNIFIEKVNRFSLFEENWLPGK